MAGVNSNKTKLDNRFSIGGDKMTKETVTMTMTKITASKGKILTNGEVYGKIIFLADTDKVENYHEITEAEYNETMKQ